MTDTKQGTLNIHSENILPIIKKWLYSEKEIFIRELVSNAHDAIQKRTILENQGEVIKEPSHRIDVEIDQEKKQLIFRDTGIGLDAEEAEKYLAQIAFSGAEEFIKAYQLNDTFIGHFGLGFFSAFMVAKTVDVLSLSAKGNKKAIRFTSDGSTAYTIATHDRTTPGTDVVLSISEGNEEFLDPTKIRACLERFCSFLPYPLYFQNMRINTNEPLWQKKPQDCTEAEYKHFYRALYPFESDPLFWIHINVDYPFHVQGILYFPKISPSFEWKKEHVRLYCNRVFVSDDCKDILPEHLTLMRGIIDSPDIPLNVSRSHLQVDKTVRQLSSHISKKVLDALQHLLQQDRARYEEAWDSIALVIKLGIVQEMKSIEKASKLLLFLTVDGKKLLLDELTSSHDKPLYYCEKGHEKSLLTHAFQEKGHPVLLVSSSLDLPLMARLEEHKVATFKRIDSAFEESIVDPTREKTLLDETGKTESAHIAQFFKKALGDQPIDVVAKSLSSNQLPALLSMSEEERRIRDYMTKVLAQDTPIKPKTTLVVNTNNPLVHAIYKTKDKNSTLADEMAKGLFDLTRLASHELSSEELTEFVERFSSLTLALAERIE